MKKTIRVLTVVLIFAVLACLLITVCFAHSGRTDSKGGHYDRKNGGYHYHHGYPAHDHPDGKCPYTTSEKTKEHKSGSNTKHEAYKYEARSMDFETDAEIICTIAFFVYIITFFIKSALDSKAHNDFLHFGRTGEIGIADFVLLFLSFPVTLLLAFRVCMLCLPIWLSAIILIVDGLFGTVFYCLPEFILSVIAFIATINGVQDGWAVAYYIFFALYLIYFVFQLIKRMLSRRSTTIVLKAICIYTLITVVFAGTMVGLCALVNAATSEFIIMLLVLPILLCVFFTGYAIFAYTIHICQECRRPESTSVLRELPHLEPNKNNTSEESDKSNQH